MSRPKQPPSAVARLRSKLAGLVLGKDPADADGAEPTPEAQPPELLHTVVSDTVSLVFHCPNQLTRDRASSVLTKEPGTISWIERFADGSTYWDIGSNIGTFALDAAAVRNCSVYAFEPAAHNFYILQKNIIANRLDKNVKALAVAIDDRRKISDLFMRDDEFGSALHVFGTNVDYTGSRYTESHLQGCLGISIDALCSDFGMDPPNYVKVDVDGLERAVVSGGLKTFADPRCRSVLVELDLNDKSEVGFIQDALHSCGLVHDESISNNVPRPHPSALVYNMIFSRQ